MNEVLQICAASGIAILLVVAVAIESWLVIICFEFFERRRLLRRFKADDARRAAEWPTHAQERKKAAERLRVRLGYRDAT